MQIISSGIYRGPEPKTPSEFYFIRNHGIGTIIDLENERGQASLEEDLCRRTGVDFISIPLSAYKPPKEKYVNEVLTKINVCRKAGVLVHCRHGQDRTGLIVGMYRKLYERVDGETAWAEMLDHGFHSILLGLTYYYWTH